MRTAIREGEDRWRDDHVARMIYSDSQSSSLNDSRPGATSCWREVLSCAVVSARSQRLPSRRLSLPSSCSRRIAGSLTGVARYLPSGGFNPLRWVWAIVRMPPVLRWVHLSTYSTFQAHLVGDNADAEWLFHGHWYFTLVNHALKKISFMKFSSYRHTLKYNCY